MNRKKKLLVVTVLLSSFFAMAQVKVSGSLPTMPITFKRCVVTGSDGYIDLLVSNESNVDMQIQIQPHFVTLYDDEGNCYTAEAHNISPILFGNNEKTMCIVPAGVAMKCRIPFSGLDEYATQFTVASIDFLTKRLGIVGSERKTIQIREIPLTRRD